MATAPSFTSYKVISEEPFVKGGKLYITVEHPNTKNHRDVRWYSDAEYDKLYGAKDRKPQKDKGCPMYKHARGFDAGPILVIRNNRPDDEPWLLMSNARYAVGVGWYIISTETLPANAPKHLKYLLLHWEEMRDGDDSHIKSPEEVARILRDKARRGEWINLFART